MPPPSDRRSPGANAFGGRAGVELRLEQVGHALALAGDLEVSREVEHAFAADRRVGGSQPQRVLGEDDGLLRGASGRRACRRCRDRVRKALFGELRRQRQVEGAKLVVTGDVRELQVESAAVTCPRAGLGRGGQERMRRAEPVAVERDHTRVERILEHALVGDRGQPRHP